jgi:hypothetical protein
MLEELQRRHYSQATTQRYIRFIETSIAVNRRYPKRIRLAANSFNRVRNSASRAAFRAR